MTVRLWAPTAESVQPITAPTSLSGPQVVQGVVPGDQSRKDSHAEPMAPPDISLDDMPASPHTTPRRVLRFPTPPDERQQSPAPSPSKAASPAASDATRPYPPGSPGALSPSLASPGNSSAALDETSPYEEEESELQDPILPCIEGDRKRDQSVLEEPEANAPRIDVPPPQEGLGRAIGEC